MIKKLLFTLLIGVFIMGFVVGCVNKNETTDQQDAVALKMKTREMKKATEIVVKTAQQYQSLIQTERVYNPEADDEAEFWWNDVYVYITSDIDNKGDIFTVVSFYFTREEEEFEITITDRNGDGRLDSEKDEVEVAFILDEEKKFPDTITLKGSTQIEEERKMLEQYEEILKIATAYAATPSVYQERNSIERSHEWHKEEYELVDKILKNNELIKVLHKIRDKNRNLQEELKDFALVHEAPALNEIRVMWENVNISITPEKGHKNKIFIGVPPYHTTVAFRSRTTTSSIKIFIEDAHADGVLTGEGDKITFWWDREQNIVLKDPIEIEITNSYAKVHKTTFSVLSPFYQEFLPLVHEYEDFIKALYATIQ
jgi:hypothetical protein